MSAQSAQTIHHWWVTASDKTPRDPWHWKEFFEDSDNPEQGLDWGGPDSINSPASFVCIKEMRKGDIVVAYQASEGVVGLVYLASDGYQHRGGANYNTFDLKPTPIVWLNQPVPYREIRNLPNAGEDIEFVQAKVKQRTVFRINPAGFNKILGLMLKLNPQQFNEICNFLPPDRSSLEAEMIAVDDIDELKPTRKKTFTTQRVIRDSVIGKRLKQLYQYECQVCGATIELPDGKRYAEVHHLRPVGKPHNGKDGMPNIIVVCPHHHAMFDLGAIAINPNTLLVEYWDPDASEHALSLIVKHRLDKASLKYHHQKLFRRTTR